ncbi:CatB-related O-acetyltransferase [Sporolactobacillus kofuensis]|nr:CatB-related O-acetyltransferase [Sporolactobacillus kofuensis]MCO7177101.1 CatB-related O-acetyltransferase [Sporolactobacillus kofuensis]
MFIKMKRLIKYLLYKYSIAHYNVPNTCKIYPSRSVKGITCEGYNTIAKTAQVYNTVLGYGSGISNESIFLNTLIGRYTVLAPEIKVITGQHPTGKFVSVHPSFYSLKKQYGFSYTDRQKFEEFKFADNERNFSVVIGNDVWIASSVLLMEGISIGDGAIVAAGAVVTKNVPPYAVVGGIPARIIRYRFEPNEIDFLLNLKWWDKDEKWIKEYGKYFDDIKKLIKVIKNNDEN